MRPAPDRSERPAKAASLAWTFSQDPALEALIARTQIKFPPLFPDGTERMRAFLKRLGDPHRRMPFVFHVAGTNGKGSTLAFLQAILEAGGLTAHKYISPHLVRFEERIVVRGGNIDGVLLADLIRECAAAAGEEPVSFFEFFTGLAYVAFSRHPADAALIETGLGGINDATNVFERDLVSVLTRISFDHMHVLGDTLEKIARHKAGIIQQGCAAVAAPQADESVLDVFRQAAREKDARLHEGWRATAISAETFLYQSDNHRFILPMPRLKGQHQIVNAGTAIAAVEQSPFAPLLRQDILEKSMARVEWPGRLQQLQTGALLNLLPPGAELWLDGAHNDSGAEILLPEIRKWAGEAPLHLITAHKQRKDCAAFYQGLLPYVETITTLGADIGPQMRTAGEMRLELLDIGFKNVTAEENLESALERLALSFPDLRRILVTGSLYLVGNALKRNGWES